MSSESEDYSAALRRMWEAKGDGYCFPADEIWPFFNVAPEPRVRPGIATALERAKYIVSTQRTIKSVSESRKGSPAREYTFGPEISPSSLTIALGAGYHIEEEDRKGFKAILESSYLDAKANALGKFPLDFPLQRILHGCPGSGKSFALQADAENSHYVIRTVFHPETRYSDFVGGLRPESIYRVTDDVPRFVGSETSIPGEPYVRYVVQPGPLLKAYHLACLYPSASVVLIIEELSRAIASHVFGDMLQLLDRRDTIGETLSGYSEYEIEPRPDIRSWLNSNHVLHDHVSVGNMRFPPNLYLWATMNRSDQNARQLDSAFLRRWSKKYLSYLQPGKYDDVNVPYGGAFVSWGNLRNFINLRLKDSEGVPEDKFVGPYFMSKRRLGDPTAIYEDLWGYIWNDVLKSRATNFFPGAGTFAELQEVWENGIGSPLGEVGVLNVVSGH